MRKLLALVYGVVVYCLFGQIRRTECPP